MQSSVILTGNVVNDVSLRQTPGGTVANFRMATNDGYFDRRTQKWVDRTTYLNVSAWRGLGENVALSLFRGQPVVVCGRLRQREFEREGQKVTVIDVDADVVGHDLTRGTASFRRTPKGPQTADLAREEALLGEQPSASLATFVTDGTGWAVPGLAVTAVTDVELGTGRAEDVTAA
jgi:single-strand DNA-binding protein